MYIIKLTISAGGALGLYKITFERSLYRSLYAILL
jgi:hypothetical protein